MKPKRPMGVAVIAVLELLFGAVATILGGILVVGGEVVASAAKLAGLGNFSASALGTFVELFGVVLVIGGVVGIIIGWGLWTGRNWARIVAMVLSVLGAASGLLVLIFGSFTGAVIFLADGAILWYFLRPNVKDYFGKAITAQEGLSAEPATAP